MATRQYIGVDHIMWSSDYPHTVSTRPPSREVVACDLCSVPEDDRQKIAWDIAGSAFGSRQVLYERFFGSDPLTRARTLNAIYPKAEVMERIWEFLRGDDSAEHRPHSTEGTRPSEGAKG